MAGAAWGNKIYVINGDAAGGATILQIYDTTTNSWSTGAGLGAHHEAAAALGHDGKVYFFGGVEEAWSNGPYVPRDAVNIYDTATDIWSTGANMPTPRWYSTVQRVGNGFHVLGGFFDADGNSTSAHDVFDP